MVELDYADDYPPLGALLDRVTLDSVEYTLYIGSASRGPRLEAWPVLTLRRTERASKGKLDLKRLLGFLTAERNLLSHGRLSSIELGNSILSGRGTTWIRRFALELSLAG